MKFSTTSQNGVSISADKSVSTENYTKTLFEIGSSPGTYSLGLMLFQNSYYDLRNTAFLEDKKIHYYMLIYSVILYYLIIQ